MNIKSLSLIVAVLSFAQIASAQSPAYQCKVDGQSVSSELPCKTATTIQTTLSNRGTGASTGSVKSASSKKYVCEAAKQDLANLNSMATQLNSSEVQDQVKQRKAAVQKIVYEWEC